MPYYRGIRFCEADEIDTNSSVSGYFPTHDTVLTVYKVCCSQLPLGQWEERLHVDTEDSRGNPGRRTYATPPQDYPR